MGLCKRMDIDKIKLAVVGLGYVGMPIALAFSKKVRTIGFDIDKKKIRKYLGGEDPTREVGDEAIRNSLIDFTWKEDKLKEANFIIVAVPTPVNGDKTPDLSPIIRACEILFYTPCTASWLLSPDCHGQQKNE
ncbi:nucleotide sugar dehydrogenase [Thermotalea metallivorans]|nr:hypothetical protein [Thermotalea metallivorans]